MILARANFVNVPHSITPVGESSGETMDGQALFVPKFRNPGAFERGELHDSKPVPRRGQLPNELNYYDQRSRWPKNKLPTCPAFAVSCRLSAISPKPRSAPGNSLSSFRCRFQVFDNSTLRFAALALRRLARVCFGFRSLRHIVFFTSCSEIVQRIDRLSASASLKEGIVVMPKHLPPEFYRCERS